MIGLVALAPLANGAFARSPIGLRILLAMVSLAEVGQAGEGVLLFTWYSVNFNRNHSLYWDPGSAA